ncbi:hypothetical protein Tco_0989229, partial [Tanacetum coccineum]
MEPEDSLIMGDENLSTIPEKESDEFIKSSVEDLVPILSESEDTSDSDNECNFPFCDNSVTFSNPLFDANDDFTSSDDESLPEEDVQEENFKIYSNLLFKFDDEYISSDVNPLFNEVLEDIESKESYVSNFDEPALLVTPLSDANEDECFDPGGDIDEIDAFLDNMIGEVDIETLTIEQYLMLTQRNQASGMVKPKFGMKEKDIEDMTIAKYMEYELKMKRQSWRNVRPYFLTKHEDTDINSFHHN